MRQKSHQKQTITGTVGGDVKVGDTVEVTLDGQSLEHNESGSRCTRFSVVTGWC